MPRTSALVAASSLVIGLSAPAVAQEAKPRVADVDWSAASTIGVSTGLEGRLKDVDKTLLPVLIPRPFFDFKSLRFIGQELEYTASVRSTGDKRNRLGGESMSVTGTRIAVDVPGATDAENPSVDVVLDEKSATATVKKYGVAYVITVECFAADNPRCTGEQWARDLVNSLELVGGGKGSPATLPAAPPAPSGLIGVAADPSFRYEAAGQLVPGTGSGVSSSTIYAANIRFPIAAKPTYLNSQVYGYGGYLGQHSNAGWRDPRNYAYPWHDNFCEKRGRKTPACPSGTGHQGVDIRPVDSADRKHVVVAVESGRISKVGVYSVTLSGNSGNHYNYLHMEMAKLKVRLGETVKAGQPIGLVSNDFGGESTSVHLHFEVMQNVNGRGWRHVPPYSSLLAAYKAM